MNAHTKRCFATAVAVVLFCTACGNNSQPAAPETTAAETAPPTTAPETPERPADTMAPSGEAAGADGHQHAHGAATTPAVEPYPSVSLRILDDPAGGWLLHSAPSNFRIAPENVSTAHVDGEGHMHLYVDGVKVMRLYGEWHQMPPLAADTHEVRVELSSNDHSAMAIDGVVVDDTVTLEVSADEATLATDDSTGAQDPTGHDMSGMDSAESAGTGSGEGTNPAQTVSIEIVDGEPVGGHQRVGVALNSEVAVTVTSDLAEEVHVHGYDILHAVSPGRPLNFSFTADIPGVFEVELEGSGGLLAQLTVS